MSCKLSVNVNAIAYLRNRRHAAVAQSLEGLARHGARRRGRRGSPFIRGPDERHVRQARMFRSCAPCCARHYPGREYNIEGYPDERFMMLAEANRPDQVTLVPDDPSQPTSDHGWDFAAHGEMLKAIIARLHKGGMRVSLFVDRTRWLRRWPRLWGLTGWKSIPVPMAGRLNLMC